MVGVSAWMAPRFGGGLWTKRFAMNEKFALDLASMMEKEGFAIVEYSTLGDSVYLYVTRAWVGGECEVLAASINDKDEGAAVAIRLAGELIKKPNHVDFRLAEFRISSSVVYAARWYEEGEENRKSVPAQCV